MTRPMLGQIACTFLACATTPAKSQNDAITVTAEILKNHLTEEISCKWYGGNTVCLFGHHHDTRPGAQIGVFLEAVNYAYDSDFKLTNVPWHDGCPDFTTICAMVSAPVGAKTLAHILESLGGSCPPSAYIAPNRLAEAHGFTLRILGNRRREFVNVDDTVPPVPSNPDPARSIVMKEMTHALSALDEFELGTIVSVLGKMSDFTYYGDWFDSNPRSPILAELILLGMQVGPTVVQLSHRGASLDWPEGPRTDAPRPSAGAAGPAVRLLGPSMPGVNFANLMLSTP